MSIQKSEKLLSAVTSIRFCMNGLVPQKCFADDSINNQCIFISSIQSDQHFFLNKKKVLCSTYPKYLVYGIQSQILNIVMQTQLTSEKETSYFQHKSKINFKTDFPNAVKNRRQNRIMIVKSFSVDHNQSLCVKSLFRKDSHSSTSKSKARRRFFGSQKVSQNDTSETKNPCRDVREVADCVEQLRHFRNLQKSDIFFKIDQIQKKISRQVNNAKKRENKRYMGECKAKKLKSNNNSINLSQISAAIKIKHIQNKQKQNDITQRLKLNTCTSFHQSKLFNLINRRLANEIESTSIDISRFIKLKKTEKNERKSETEEFSAWKTEYDPDF